ncbi:MAG TPA: L-seryl-tRNA(Sec) selenium transferase [Chloroflexota bacterium]|nr:L-seryl-tRNA(Sec) selenium transferase [Chloroflexota bacterium]
MARVGGSQDWRRTLPAVETVLRETEIEDALAVFGRGALTTVVREHLDALRGRALPGSDVTPAAIARIAIREAERRFALSPEPVINATGVIIHTNLGRAPLSEAAIHAITQVASGYSALEYDVERGARGSRNDLLSPLLSQLTGAEDGVVVNNGAAAVQLVLAATAGGREVIVSRGQAVEIGGGFRIPAILAQSGAKLVEVGTTNRTRLADYAEAITSRTAALLHVHPSNFRVSGFTESVNLADLAALGKQHGIAVINDVGSGCLLDLTPYGLAPEPLVQDSVSVGVDVVCFSGDKLLGGPQCGIIIGGFDFIARIRRHSLLRAMRVDKITIAALHATLLHYLRGEALKRIPIWRMIAASPDALNFRARTWLEATKAPATVRLSIEPGQSTIGGGSTPGETLATTVLAIRAVGAGRGWAAKLAAELRHAAPAVLGRVDDGALLLDPRTVLPNQDPLVARALQEALERLS